MIFKEGWSVTGIVCHGLQGGVLSWSSRKVVCHGGCLSWSSRRCVCHGLQGGVSVMVFKEGCLLWS